MARWSVTAYQASVACFAIAPGRKRDSAFFLAFGSSSSSSRGFDFFLALASSSSDVDFAWYFFFAGAVMAPSHSGQVFDAPSSDCSVCPQSAHLMVTAIGQFLVEGQ